MGKPTSANTVPNLIRWSTALSPRLLISGEYLCNNSSSSWTIERRDSACERIISWLRWAVAKRRTVLFATNWNSKEQLCFPMKTTSAALHQEWADLVVNTTDSKSGTRACRSSNNYWKALEGRPPRSSGASSPTVDDCSSFGSPCASGMSDKHLCIRTEFSKYILWGKIGHTGVALASRSGCLPSIILSAHFLWTNTADTSVLGHLAMWYLYVARNKRYRPKLKWSGPHGLDTGFA